VTTATRSRTLGHLALYYVPGCEAPARRLLEDIGCTLVENGPAPGRDGFCTVLLDGATANHADNLLFLAPMSAEQQALETAIESGLGGDGVSALGAFRDRQRNGPESASHLGIRFATMDALEETLAAIARDVAPGGPLAGHVELTKYAARPGLDPAVDARMAASPAFTGDERPAFADHWVQCFAKSDLFGMLSSARTIELDFVFEPFYDHLPPRFG